jgi:hypothetical protein
MHNKAQGQSLKDVSNDLREMYFTWTVIWSLAKFRLAKPYTYWRQKREHKCTL